MVALTAGCLATAMEGTEVPTMLVVFAFKNLTGLK